MDLTHTFNVELSLSKISKKSSKYIYIFIPGLYSHNFGSKYMKDNISILKNAGLDVRKIDVSKGKVLANAKIIRDYISTNLQKNNKKIIIIGHSKGVVDVGVAIAKYNLYDKIHCLISLQAPWKGTNIVNEEAYYGIAKHVHKAVSFINDTDDEAYKDLSHKERKYMRKKYPLDTRRLKIISFTSTIQDNPPIIYIIPNLLLQKKWGIPTDGIVTRKESTIPGSHYVHINNFAHNQSVINFGIFPFPGDITIALVNLACDI